MSSPRAFGFSVTPVTSPQSAERDVADLCGRPGPFGCCCACQNASYRVTLVPSLARQGRESRRRGAPGGARSDRRPMNRTPARCQRPQTPNSFTAHSRFFRSRLGSFAMLLAMRRSRPSHHHHRHAFGGPWQLEAAERCGSSTPLGRMHLASLSGFCARIVLLSC